MQLLNTLRTLLCSLVKQAKGGLSGTIRQEPKPKRTRQGDGQRSKASHRRKKSRGQGR
jgi:hypothetical protein